MARFSKDSIRAMSTWEIREEIRDVKTDIRRYDNGPWFPSVFDARRTAEDDLANLYEELRRREPRSSRD